MFDGRNYSSELILDLAAFFTPHLVRVSFEKQIMIKMHDVMNMQTTNINGKVRVHYEQINNRLEISLYRLSMLQSCGRLRMNIDLYDFKIFGQNSKVT